MLQSSTTSSTSANKDDNRTNECLSQLRVKICSVRLPSSSKLVDICVIMEVDSKYSYRTEVIRRKSKVNTNATACANHPVIPINESFDVLVTSNSKIKLKVLSPSRVFSNHDIGQMQFTVKAILDDYGSSEQIMKNDMPSSYRAILPFDSLMSTSSLFRSNDTHPHSNGTVEIMFCGALLEQKRQQRDENGNLTSSQQVNISISRINSLIYTHMRYLTSRIYSIHLHC
jgi:hypothetical protein